MNYANYKQFREEVLAEKCPLRLDCMNPVRALASWAKKPERLLALGPIGAVDAWSRATRITLSSDQTVVSVGVRDLLSAALSWVLERDQELWLPEDVYPVYWELARCAGASTRAFTTVPHPNWDFLAQTSRCAAVLVPVPLSPVGRLPTDVEFDVLFRWLKASRHRLLIIDAVYSFNFSAGRTFLDALLADNQCLILWSCSKSWLCPGVLGIAKVPSELAPNLQRRVTLPSNADAARISAILEYYPELPRMQQEAFDREWHRLTKRIRAAMQDWQPPPTGYFSVLSAQFTRLLDEYDILAVPATVFGSRRNDLSIITCLHDLAAHEIQ